MSQAKEGKVLYLNTLTESKHKNKRSNPKRIEPFSDSVAELRRKDPELYFGTLEPEEEIELQIVLYDEVKTISSETGSSFEEIVEFALREYVEKYRKPGRKVT